MWRRVPVTLDQAYGTAQITQNNREKFSLPRSPLARHEREQRVTSAVIDHVISSVEQGEWAYDDWVRSNLVYSVNSLLHGRYRLANVEALKAQTPLRCRSPEPFNPAPNIPLDQLRRAFDQIRAMPAQEFPSFR